MSGYVRTLSEDARKDYLFKLTQFGFSEDLFSCSGWNDNPREWPVIEFGQIYVYLVETPGPFTAEKMRAYKSLDAYNFYSSGWVQTVQALKSPDGKHLALRAKVMKSQKTTDKPHQAWVIIHKNADVKRAHCTCMAGLGEVCSHIAAILFKVEAYCRIVTKDSCTSLPCAWNKTFVKKVEPARMETIDLSKPKHGRDNKKDNVKKRTLKIDDPTDVIAALKHACPDASLFTITEPKKRTVQPSNLPPSMHSLFNDKLANACPDELAEACRKSFADLKVSEDESAAIERLTRSQSSSPH